MDDTMQVSTQLLTLLEDYNDFNSHPIVPERIPSAVQFGNQVRRNYPCVYDAYKRPTSSSGGQLWVDPSLLTSPAFSWTRQDVLDLVDEKVEVAITPNGRADDLVLHNDEYIFALPGTVRMTMSELFDKLENPVTKQASPTSQSPVYYLQSQDSNLTSTELSPILKHVPSNFPFAEAVLGEPEAINIWVGDERSVTSTHRDPYENLYLVLSGQKTFILYPPVAEVVLPTRSVRTGSYVFDERTKAFSIELSDANADTNDPSLIPWVSIDPLRPKEELIAEYPDYKFAYPRLVTVNEGQILYLPCGWYHHVQQKCGTWNGERAPCIAVNYWYDFDYSGETYAMRQLLRRLVAAAKDKDQETANRDEKIR